MYSNRLGVLQSLQTRKFRPGTNFTVGNILTRLSAALGSSPSFFVSSSLTSSFVPWLPHSEDPAQEEPSCDSSLSILLSMSFPSENTPLMPLNRFLGFRTRLVIRIDPLDSCVITVSEAGDSESELAFDDSLVLFVIAAVVPSVVCCVCVIFVEVCRLSDSAFRCFSVKMNIFCYNFTTDILLCFPVPKEPTPLCCHLQS